MKANYITDLAGLHPIYNLTSTATDVSTFMVSHRVIIVLSGGVCLLSMLIKESGTSNLYMSSRNRIKY